MRKEIIPSEMARQILLLDADSRILRSCDTLFSTQDLNRQFAVTLSPFLESVFPMLLALPIATPMSFPRVENPARFLTGVYDFVFKKIMNEGKAFVEWTILDHTQKYEARRLWQQQHHNQAIQQELAG